MYAERVQRQRNGRHDVVSAWPGYLQRVEALEKIDARLAANPDEVDAHFERGRLLTDLGRPEEARGAYFEVIKRAPAHFGALNNLGGLLYAGGFRSAARSAYAEAVARNPDNPLGHFNLGNLLREEGELDGARAEYEATLRLAPDHAEAHRGMALILQENGDGGCGSSTSASGISRRRRYRVALSRATGADPGAPVGRRRQRQCAFPTPAG